MINFKKLIIYVLLLIKNFKNKTYKQKKLHNAAFHIYSFFLKVDKPIYQVSERTLDLLEQGETLERVMLRGGWQTDSTAMSYLRNWIY